MKKIDPSLEEFFQTEKTDDGITLKVCIVRWNGHSEPFAEWKAVAVLPARSPGSRIDAEKLTLLSDRRFFRVCKACGEINNVGNCGADDICHECLQKSGIVF